MKYKENKPENKILQLIDKVKDLGDKNLPAWIISRRRLLIFIIDIFIFISISLIYQPNFNFSNKYFIYLDSFSYISIDTMLKISKYKRIKYKRKCLKNTSLL